MNSGMYGIDLIFKQTADREDYVASLEDKGIEWHYIGDDTPEVTGIHIAPDQDAPEVPEGALVEPEIDDFPF